LGVENIIVLEDLKCRLLYEGIAFKQRIPHFKIYLTIGKRERFSNFPLGFNVLIAIVFKQKKCLPPGKAL